MSSSAREVWGEGHEGVLLFVYGSLKRGCCLHGYLADNAFIGSAVTQPRYALFDCGSYPALVKTDVDGQAVTGEVYRISQAVLQVLDEVEGVSAGLYRQEPVELQPPYSAETVRTYIYQQSTAQLRRVSQWPL